MIYRLFPWLTLFSKPEKNSIYDFIDPCYQILILGRELKIQSFEPPIAKFWPNTFQYISIYFSKSWFPPRYIKNKNCFVKDLHWTTSSRRWEWLGMPEPPQKCFRKFLFLGLRLFLGHFGQQTPESPMSQLQKGVSTSLPPFFVDLLIIKVYPRFFRVCSIADFTSGLQWAETAVL